MVRRYHAKEYWEQRLRAHFDLTGVGHISFGGSYNRWLYRRKRACIASYFGRGSLKGKDVLDVGCGTGFFVDWYLRRGAHVSGIDITEVSVGNLSQRYPGDFRVLDITAADYQPTRKFDVVNMWDVIYHVVEHESFERALTNIAASLKTDGLFLFKDWFARADDAKVADHVQARGLATYMRLLPKRGFDLVEVRPLYLTLNRRHFGDIDEHLGWLYFAVDCLFARATPDNVSLGIWRYRG